MRIISQNGKIDVPYEIAAFHATDYIVYMNMAGETGKGTIMAEYSAPEKTKMAMDILHREYTGIMPSLMIDKGANFNPEDMEALKKSLTGAIVRPAKQGDVEVHMLPRVFRFPADDEIEVEEC